MKGDTPAFTRLVGTEKWETHKPSGQPDDGELLLLGLVRQTQLGKGNHWSLFVAEEGQPGTVYQVKGDHTYMTYGHRQNINILCSRSFRDIHQLAELDAQKSQRVAYWANQEPPPRAETQAQVRETCQSWVIRVVRRLIAEGIVEQKWDQELQNLIDSHILLNLRDN